MRVAEAKVEVGAEAGAGAVSGIGFSAFSDEIYSMFLAVVACFHY